MSPQQRHRQLPPQNQNNLGAPLVVGNEQILLQTKRNQDDALWPKIEG
jgi:hypothetical protein